MPRSAPFAFCRYEFAINDSSLTGSEQFTRLQQVRGRLIAYRKQHPTPADENTFLMRPRQKTISGRTILTWEIAEQQAMRERTRYDPDSDETWDEAIETDEIKHTKFIAIPEFGVVAVDDRISERNLGARSAVGRAKAIFETIPMADARITFAGTPHDLQRALETWVLDKFSFSVRPFNPTPRALGEELHEWMKKDGIGQVRGFALPTPDHNMRDSHQGLIAEAKGLSDAGYGQISATGTTPSGLQASFNKPALSNDKQKNLERQTHDRMLRIYIAPNSSTEEEEAAVVNALLEFYGD
jgi:hypothetical protein